MGAKKISKLKLVHSEIITPKHYIILIIVCTIHHYPAPITKYKTGKLWFSFRFENKLLGIKFINSGEVDNPKIKIEIYYNEELEEKYIQKLLEELSYRFQLDKDDSEFYKRFEKDKLVGKVLKNSKACIDFASTDFMNI